MARSKCVFPAVVLSLCLLVAAQPARPARLYEQPAMAVVRWLLCDEFDLVARVEPAA